MIEIAGHKIGAGQAAFIIAEAGVNHNGDLKMAHELVDVAAGAGADAVKFQTFIAEKSITSDAIKADYQRITTGNEESQLEMAQKLELSFDDFRQLKRYCDERGIVFLSTPFDFESVDFLHSLGVPALKISSGDLTNHPLLRRVASKGVPVIVSTGMSDLDEVREATEVVRSEGNDQIVLLQCVTNYPADPGDVNLRAMRTMAEALNVPVGYSDHTLGIEVAIGAVALGACVIEKHFTLDRSLPGPDHRASLEPRELEALVHGIRRIEAALGTGIKRPAASEASNAAVARRSLVAGRDIQAGSVLTADCVSFKRPGTGLPPKMLERVVGKTMRVDLREGTLLELDMFE
ncbi:MAG TPA: N-acetylneuraminate synthase [Pyrinomonadaceae bacterium]|nr:N-acetylneuraminate synthase [Pyrinomonadaceae bacterium]